MDAHEVLVFESDTSFTCLGRGGEFVLVNNAGNEDCDRISLMARRHGWAYCGVFGLGADGVPRAESEADHDSRYTMMRAGLQFCQIVSDRIRNPEKGDSVGWLRRLYSLSDTRGCLNA